MTRLAAVRTTVAECNNNRPLYVALTPHESVGGAEETEKDVAILLKQALVGGWKVGDPKFHLKPLK